MTHVSAKIQRYTHGASLLRADIRSEGTDFTPAQYQIARSLRFNSADNPGFHRTLGTPTATNTWTWFTWLKISELGQGSVIFGGTNGSSSSGLWFNQTESATSVDLRIYDLGTLRATTTALLRDPSAFTCLTLNYNGTTANLWMGDRLLYSGAITLTYMNVATMVQSLGYFSVASGYSFGGYFADPHFIDGQALSYTSFIETDPTTGALVPKSYSGSFGNNGGHWKLDDNSGATSTTIGKDSSGNGNNFTPVNISVTAGVSNDSLVDTPTPYGTDTGAGGEVPGNYCTLSQLDMSGTVTTSEGNLKVSFGGDGKIMGSMPIPSSGKWGFEFRTASGSAGVDVGLARLDVGMASRAAEGANTIHVRDNNTSVFVEGVTNTSQWASTYGANVWVQCLIDRDAGTIQFKTATDDTNALSFTNTYPWGVYVSASTSDAADFNFGARPFEVASLPAGYKALCTQNLPDPAILNPSSEFAAVIDTESNIDATLAAASGWSDYVRILKNRSNAETWAWQFSHDSSNEYAVSTTATRQTKRTNSGSDNWAGYAFKVNGVAGIKANSIGHTNGADTTVTHNSGVSARQLILLFPRSGGEVAVYHPDCTAGKLLNLTGTDLETTSSTIKTVTSNSFKIDTSVASDTYDYLVIPETVGFCNLFKYTGTASADGPMVSEGLRPTLAFGRTTTLATDNYAWFAVDAVRDTYNPAGKSLAFNKTNDESGESGGVSLDFLANGFKLRGTNGTSNGSGVYVGLAVGLSFKYARAA